MIAKALNIIMLATETASRISKLPTSQAQTNALKRNIEASDVFLGVLAEGGGEHQILVRGRRILEDIVASDEPRIVRQGAIFVSCVDGMPGAPSTDYLH